MILLLLGVVLWIGAHSLRRVAPGLRAKLGEERGRGMIAGVVGLSIVLMVVGYKMSDGSFWWGATPATVGINNLLMVVAFYFFAASGMKTRVARKVHHPMLIGFSVWALAHMLVNGDLPSLVLFGGLLAWALWEIAGNTNPAPAEGEVPPMKKDLMALLGGVVVTVVVGLIHGWIGPWPFGG